MQINGTAGGARPAQQQPGAAAGGDAKQRLGAALDRGDPQELSQLSENPRASSLAAKLRDPKWREKLTEVLGDELVGKLDKIFNAPAAGDMPAHVVQDMLKQQKEALAQAMGMQQPGAQQPGAQQPGRNQPPDRGPQRA